MAKYVLVDKAPENLDKGCFVIGAPNFLEEIKQCVKKKPRSNTMTVNYLREIVSTIGLKYAPDDFNPLTDVNVAPFRGIPCKTDQDTHRIVLNALSKTYPKMFDHYVDYHIKHRPSGTKLIYFLGTHHQSSSFTLNGIDNLSTKDIDVYLGKKEKKVVGKPAVKKEITEKPETKD